MIQLPPPPPPTDPNATRPQQPLSISVVNIGLSSSLKIIVNADGSIGVFFVNPDGSVTSQPNYFVGPTDKDGGRNIYIKGADGSVQQVLHVDKNGNVTIVGTLTGK